jgi:hypothetical protein
LTGSEPVQYDTLYRAFQVNRETGRLATVFTPPEQIDEQIYLVVPPDAQAWAEQADLPTPPDEYDVIMIAPVSVDAPVRISSPVLFTYVKGQVSFTGNANGDNFSFYRLQVGEGLNPRQWLQITEDIQTPVKDGLLGIWNTEGMSGLYAIQLLVVYQDQHVETAVTQVTVDNRSPELTILSPISQQTFSQEDKAIVLQVTASDDLQLESVTFLLDGNPVAHFTQAPFLIALDADPGNHTFTAQVIDQAGNEAQSEVKFEVTR